MPLYAIYFHQKRAYTLVSECELGRVHACGHIHSDVSVGVGMGVGIFTQAWVWAWARAWAYSLRRERGRWYGRGHLHSGLGLGVSMGVEVVRGHIMFTLRCGHFTLFKLIQSPYSNDLYLYVHMYVPRAQGMHTSLFGDIVHRTSASLLHCKTSRMHKQGRQRSVGIPHARAYYDNNKQ